MGLSKLSEECQNCPLVDECDQKRMESLGYLALPEPQIAMSVGRPGAVEAAQPLLRETMTIHVEGKQMTVYKDEIEKQIYSQLYSSMGLPFGG